MRSQPLAHGFSPESTPAGTLISGSNFCCFEATQSTYFVIAAETDWDVSEVDKAFSIDHPVQGALPVQKKVRKHVWSGLGRQSKRSCILLPDYVWERTVKFGLHKVLFNWKLIIGHLCLKEIGPETETFQHAPAYVSTCDCKHTDFFCPSSSLFPSSWSRTSRSFPELLLRLLNKGIPLSSTLSSALSTSHLLHYNISWNLANSWKERFNLLRRSWRRFMDAYS